MSCLSWYLYRGAFAPLFFAGSHFMQKGVAHAEASTHAEALCGGSVLKFNLSSVSSLRRLKS